MKVTKMLLIATLSIFTTSVNAQTTTDTIKVNGECGMCKSRIQEALKIDGITTASWDPESKILLVEYDASKITNEDIQKKLAAIGHDTENYPANDSAYEQLPGCCKYDRKPVGNNNQKQKEND